MNKGSVCNDKIEVQQEKVTESDCWSGALQKKIERENISSARVFAA